MFSNISTTIFTCARHFWSVITGMLSLRGSLVPWQSRLITFYYRLQEIKLVVDTNKSNIFTLNFVIKFLYEYFFKVG